MRRAVFLDRDGVVNELVYHTEQEVIDSPFAASQFRLSPSAAEAINALHGAGFLVVVVSNQPGIGKGHMSKEAFESIRQRMISDLGKGNACLDGEYYCFHHPEAAIAEYRLDCDCRKPKPGLLLQAAQEKGIDLGTSWMVGDNLSDVKAGKSAGCRTVLLGKMKCELCNLMDVQDARPDMVYGSLTDIAGGIIGEGLSGASSLPQVSKAAPDCEANRC